MVAVMSRIITHGVEARAVILGYVRTGVAVALRRGDPINGIPYGVAMLTRVLGRAPTPFEVQFAQMETQAELGKPASASDEHAAT